MDLSSEETPEESPALKPKRNGWSIVMLISQVVTFGCLISVVLTANRMDESKQKIIDRYQNLVGNYEKNLVLKDSIITGKDSIIGLQREIIVMNNRIIHRYETMSDDYINHLKKDNQNAKILLTHACQQ